MDPDYASPLWYDFQVSGLSWNTVSGCTPTTTLVSGQQQITTTACATTIDSYIGLTVGKTYTFSMDADRNGVSSIDIKLYSSTTGTGGTLMTTIPVTTSGSMGSYRYTFVATTAYLRYELVKTSTAAGTFKIDNLKIGRSNSRYKAVAVMKADYYPYGMTMPGRTYNNGNYRYGYNGMEFDPELKGNGNSYTTEFRQYDPRLGRWLSLDPLMMMFPDMSPYCAFDDNPIYFTDPYGLSPGPGDPPGGDPNATPAMPNVGYVCYDETTDQLFEHEGNGDWKPYTSGDEFTDKTHLDVRREIYFGNLGTEVKKAEKPVGNTDPRGSTEEIGGLSAKYESRGGVGTVSSGKGDPGGVSYGAWQFATKKNVPQKFLKHEGSVYAERFKGLEAGTPEFSAVWKKIAEEDPDGFRKIQYAFTVREYYSPYKSRVDKTTSLNVDSRPAVFKDILWSISVQHGPGNNVIKNALAGKDLSKMTNEQIIRAIYTERMNLDKYFPSTTDPAQKAGLKNRFKNEMEDAIKRL